MPENLANIRFFDPLSQLFWALRPKPYALGSTYSENPSIKHLEF